MREKIDQHYRVRLILDNLPITTYDLEENPESIRPGYEIGFAVDGKYYLNNHLMFKILVHKTNGQYSKARQEMAELEAAAVVEVCLSHAHGSMHPARNEMSGPVAPDNLLCAGCFPERSDYLHQHSCLEGCVSCCRRLDNRSTAMSGQCCH